MFLSKDKIAVVVVSDLHINSTTALCKPIFNLDDGGTYHASPNQKELWKFWLKFISDVERLTEGFKRLIVLNGDIGELDSKKRTNQLISRNKSEILKNVVDTIDPLVSISDAGIIVVRGTPAHSGKSSWLEEEVAKDLDGVIKYSDKIYSHYHFKKSISGVKFDISHHGKMGGVRHTQKTYGIRLAQDVLDKYRDRDETPPDVIIRSHQHRRADSGQNWKSFAIFTPCWQLPNEYIHRIGGENDFPDIGGDIFLCTNDLNDIKRLGPNSIVYPNFVWSPLSYIPNGVGKRWGSLKV